MAKNWLQHTLARSGWRPRNQATMLAGMGVLLALVLGSLYLSQVVSFAVTNREIEELIAERDRLERANEQLRVEIAAFQTVPRLLSRAQELGFEPASAADIEYLVIDGYNPNREPSVVPLSDQADYTLAPTYDETFSGWVQQQWDALRAQFETFGDS